MRHSFKTVYPWTHRYLNECIHGLVVRLNIFSMILFILYCRSFIFALLLIINVPLRDRKCPNFFCLFRDINDESFRVDFPFFTAVRPSGTLTYFIFASGIRLWIFVLFFIIIFLRTRHYQFTTADYCQSHDENEDKCNCQQEERCSVRHRTSRL